MYSILWQIYFIPKITLSFFSFITFHKNYIIFSIIFKINIYIFYTLFFFKFHLFLLLLFILYIFIFLFIIYNFVKSGGKFRNKNIHFPIYFLFFNNIFCNFLLFLIPALILIISSILTLLLNLRP